MNNREELYRAAISCRHEITHDQIILYVESRKEGNALSQLADRLEQASLASQAKCSTCNQSENKYCSNAFHLASQAQQESQWISVEERLPEMAQKVFGIYESGMCAFMRVRSEDDTWCWAIGRDDLYNDFFYDADDDYQVTHWMPLPPAPDGEKP